MPRVLNTEQACLIHASHHWIPPSESLKGLRCTMGVLWQGSDKWAKMDLFEGWISVGG